MWQTVETRIAQTAKKSAMAHSTQQDLGDAPREPCGGKRGTASTKARSLGGDGAPHVVRDAQMAICNRGGLDGATGGAKGRCPLFRFGTAICLTTKVQVQVELGSSAVPAGRKSLRRVARFEGWPVGSGPSGKYLGGGIDSREMMRAIGIGDARNGRGTEPRQLLSDMAR
jgi:hypothetical protein